MKIIDLFRWKNGRQETGYEKMFLGGSHWPFKFDMYLLKFSEGSEIPEHKDEVSGGRHYRFNIILKKAKMGGEFKCLNPILETQRIKLFRPDISSHSVSKIISGNRYVLSIGWLIHT